MKAKDDSLTKIAQVSQWRCLWDKLLAPRKTNDEEANNVQKNEIIENDDLQRPQVKTNNTD